MQRRRLVEGFVEAHQYVEHQAEGAVQRRPLEGEAQRPEQEAGHADDLRGEQAQGVAIHFAAAGWQQEGQAVEQVDRPVRHDGPKRAMSPRPFCSISALPSRTLMSL